MPSKACLPVCQRLEPEGPECLGLAQDGKGCSMTRGKNPRPESAEPETAATGPFVTESPLPTEAPAEPEAAIPDPAPETRPTPPAPRRSGILGPILGGALAAAGGFALSEFNVFGFAARDSSAELASLSAQLAELQSAQSSAQDQISGQLATLGDRVSALESAPPPAPADLSRVDALEQRLAEIEAVPADGNASTAALAAKITDLEQRLASLPANGPDPSLQQKLDDALSRLAEAEAAATARATEAAATAEAARRAVAFDALSDAVVSGRPFAKELAAFADPDLTTALDALAETGVPTLASLQETFPDAAREALRTARDANAEDTWSDRLVDFLASQTGARSLAPREGDDPDAVLSRAEFALSQGRVADALAELDALDPAVRVPLEPWSGAAKAHLSAGEALTAARGG